MKTYENILVEQSAPAVERIVINRPKVLNALNQATLRELSSALGELDPSTRVVVITGAGEKSFIAGADITEMSAFSVTEAAAFSRLGHSVLERLESMSAVVIAEVNGFAFGGGCEFLLACDFAIASDNAKIGQPEVGLGIIAGFGGCIRLSKRVGPARARQMLYTGDPVTAAEAKTLGLVNEVLPQPELRARVDAIAARIVKNGPFAVKQTKRTMRLVDHADPAAAMALEQQAFALCFDNADQKEGMRAFVEKRKASWPTP